MFVNVFVSVFQLEQDQLKTDVTTILQENRTLSSQVKNFLKMESDVDSRHRYSEGAVVNNLQNQINLLLKVNYNKNLILSHISWYWICRKKNPPSRSGKRLCWR